MSKSSKRPLRKNTRSWTVEAKLKKSAYCSATVGARPRHRVRYCAEARRAAPPNARKYAAMMRSSTRAGPRPMRSENQTMKR
jgi:hypothetical protein